MSAKKRKLNRKAPHVVIAYPPLNAVPRILGRPLHTVPASQAGLAMLFRGRMGRELGVEPKTLYNLRSELLRAVKAYSVLTPSLISRIQPSPAWATLLASANSPNYASGIRKFACFCTIFEVEPYQVGSPDLLLGFYDALGAEGMVKNPRKSMHLVISYWNMHAKRVSAWPQVRLSSLSLQSLQPPT